MKFALLALALVTSVPAAAVTLSFDDVPGETSGETQITNYDGFSFSNFNVLNTAGFYPSGYVNGVVSGTDVAYNGDGRTASAVSSATPFSLTSGYFAAAWNDGLTVTVKGSLAGIQQFTQSFVVDTSRSIFETFNPALIDTVVFTTAGGTHHSGYDAGLGTQLSLDDLTINGLSGSGNANSVPEPATWALMVVGFGLVGATLRRPARPRAA